MMGVAGTGTRTVARLLARHLTASYIDVRDMAPDHREPFPGPLSRWLSERRRDGVFAVATCPALTRRHRDLLRSGDPGLYFIHLSAGRDLLVRRVRRLRDATAAALLEAQLAELEPLHDDEEGVVIDATATPAELVQRILAVVSALVPAPEHPDRPMVT
ncbi:gluconokinase [Marinactinospora thermotolerans DSM 45154]|uniref:gluconokinase n=2 Tax=Marinactinospora thermotolerans TaxID=531310 RepID=A0A1T4M4D1_9ACTN|nr:gluconokinase [Marinactinospora thermotolerans DSM 45154]